MPDQIAPARGARQSNAERTAADRADVKASVPKPLKESLRGRAEKQAKAAKAADLKAAIAAMDDQTSEDKRRAAERALARLTAVTEAPPVELVWVTVRKKGDGKISMGLHEPPYGEVHHEAGERLQLPIDTAKAYGPDGKDWVEIDDPEV